MPSQRMRRPIRQKVIVKVSKSQRMGPRVRKKSTPRMKSKQPKSMPAHMMAKVSLPMVTGTSRANPWQRRRSPFATVT